ARVAEHGAAPQGLAEDEQVRAPEERGAATGRTRQHRQRDALDRVVPGRRPERQRLDAEAHRGERAELPQRPRRAPHVADEREEDTGSGRRWHGEKGRVEASGAKIRGETKTGRGGSVQGLRDRLTRHGLAVSYMLPIPRRPWTNEALSSASACSWRACCSAPSSCRSCGRRSRRPE